MNKIKKAWQPLLLILITIAILIGGLVYVSSIKNAFWQQTVTDMKEITAQGAHSFDVYVDKDVRMLRSISISLSQGTSDDTEYILGRLEAFDTASAGNYSVIDLNRGVMYLDKDGNMITLSEEELDAYKTLSGRSVREPYMSVVTGQKMLGYYECFTFVDGAKGIVQKEMLHSTVSDEFSLSFCDDTGFSYIVNSKGKMLIRSSHKNSNRTFLNLFDIIDLNGNSKKELDRFRAALDAGESGVSIFKYEKEEYVYTYVPLSGATDGWYMISIIPNRVIAKQTNKAMKSTGVFAGLIMSVMAIMALFTILTHYNRKRLSEKEIEIVYREQLFNMLANNTSDVFVMFSTDDAHKVDYVSPNIERVLGITPDEVKADLSILRRKSDEDTDIDYYANLNNLPPNGSTAVESERINRKTGERRWFAETAYKETINDTGKFVIALSDRTHEIKQREALEHALKIAEVANKAKSTFLSNMSHDIRTPMNAIVGLCTLLENDADNPELVRDHTRKISASSHHLLGLINDVLDMSKIESGKTTLNVSEFNLFDTIEEIETIIRSQTEAKGQSFEISAEGIQSGHLVGDKLRVNQVLINILSNAVKYTPEGGKIRFTVEQLPQRTKHYTNLRFIVEDNGIGMSKEFLEIVFDPFEREINSTINSIQGTGLGMPITKNLVELMGGTINVESEPNVGSTFTVNLEFRLQDENPNKENDGGRKEKNDDVLKGKHILAAEDNELNSEILIAFLDMAGAACDVAANGMEIVERFNASEPGEYDMIFMDIQMPIMNGYEAARAIRSGDHPMAKTIPIIAMTANAFVEDVKNALDAGMDAHVAKPIDMNVLMQTVAEVLRKKRK